MITAVDCSVIIDILVDDPNFADRSMAALRQAKQDGRLIICDIVIAEISPMIGGHLDDFLKDFSLDYLPTPLAAAQQAGELFSTYLKRGGKRGRIVADFLIGAHATHEAHRLLSRDDGFQRDYFSELDLWYP